MILDLNDDEIALIQDVIISAKMSLKIQRVMNEALSGPAGASDVGRIMGKMESTVASLERKMGGTQTPAPNLPDNVVPFNKKLLQ